MNKINKIALVLSIAIVGLGAGFFVFATSNFYVVSGMNSLDGGTHLPDQTWRAQCVNGYGVVGIWDNANNFSDIDAMKCGQLASSYTSCTNFGSLNSLNGGPNDLYSQWKAQCTGGRVVTGFWDDNDVFGDPDDMKCCTLKDSSGNDLLANYSDCQGIYNIETRDGGPSDVSSIWSVQCPDNYAMVGMWDSTTGFVSPSAIKCCRVANSTPALNVSCSASPSSINVNDSSTFIPSISGGTGSYTYAWSGACTGSSQNCTHTFTSAGTQTATLNVTSGSQTRSASCSVVVNNPAPTLNVSCSASPSSINTNQSTTFISSVSGGSGSYFYSWSGACTGTSQNCSHTFTNSGTQTATLNVTSGSQTRSASCSVVVNQYVSHSYKQCYNNDSYWYDSNNVRNDLFQTCSLNQTCTSGACVDNGPQVCSGCPPTGTILVNVDSNNSQNQPAGQLDMDCQTVNTYPCATFGDGVGTVGYNAVNQLNFCVNEIAKYATGATNLSYLNISFVEVTKTAPNCTTQLGGIYKTYRVTYAIKHDHQGCYGNNVYWFDSNNVRNDLIQTCSANQTCSGGSCITNPDNLTLSCSSSPSSINVNQSTTFISSVSGGNGSYAYSWSGACTGSSQNCTRTQTSAGTKTATVSVISGSQTISASCSVAVSNPTPTLNISCFASPSSINAGQSTTFISSVSGGNGSYTYSWSGACSGSSQNCTHAFPSAGTYSANLSVFSGGETATTNCPVVVANPTPTLNVSCSASPSSINAGQSTTFISSVSGGTGSYTYSWSGACSGSSQNCSQSFTNAGTQSATINVTSGGQTASASCPVTVNNPTQNLVVSCTASPSSINTNQSTTFISSVSGGNGSYTYSWSGACTGSSQNCSRTFTGIGSQTAVLNVISGTQLATASCPVVVTNATQNLNISCSASPSSINVNQSTTFISSVSGGNGSYTYSWSGACSGSSQNCTNTFFNSGVQSANLTVFSGGETATTNCPVVVSNSSSQRLTVSCYASPGSINAGQSTTFIASVSGGEGNYSYRWSVGCNGTASSCTNSFPSQGTYSVNLNIISGSQMNGASCSVVVNSGNNNPNNLGCYNDDVYWFDSFGNRQWLYQDCGSGYCQNGFCQNIVNNCECTSGPCCDGCHYKPAYQTCGTDYQQDYGCPWGTILGSDVGVRTRSRYQFCSGYTSSCSGSWGNWSYSDWNVASFCNNSQTCSSGSPTCQTTNPPVNPPTYILHYTKGCFNSDLYWYDSLNARQEIYRTCQDSNDCTIDGCSGSRCTNDLKCDGTTCQKGTANYCASCQATACGDSVCDCGETISSCAKDCSVIGLAVNILGKKEDNSIQWTKIFDASANQGLNFLVVVSNGQEETMRNVSVKTDLPSDIIYNGNLTLDGAPYAGDIREGISLGDLTSKTVRTLTFSGKVADKPERTDTSILATVTTSSGSSSDNVRITLPRGSIIATSKAGLASLAGLDFSKPLYILLWIIAAIVILLIISKILKGFSRRE